MRSSTNGLRLLAQQGRPVGDPEERNGMVCSDRDRIKAADAVEMQINRTVTYALPRIPRIG
jgi:hypothetical protein